MGEEDEALAVVCVFVAFGKHAGAVHDAEDAEVGIVLGVVFRCVMIRFGGVLLRIIRWAIFVSQSIYSVNTCISTKNHSCRLVSNSQTHAAKICPFWSLLALFINKYKKP